MRPKTTLQCEGIKKTSSGRALAILGKSRETGADEPRGKSSPNFGQFSLRARHETKTPLPVDTRHLQVPAAGEGQELDDKRTDVNSATGPC